MYVDFNSPNQLKCNLAYDSTNWISDDNPKQNIYLLRIF